MAHGERFNCVSHFLGLLLALAGGVWLLADAIASGLSSHIVGAAVFTAATIFLFLASATYHAVRGPFKKHWEKLDYCAIFALIAGTVTPFVLNAAMDWLSWSAFVAIWLLALWGIVKELRSSHGSPPALRLYLGLGWIGVFAVLRHWSSFNQPALVLLLAGAFAYTVGTFFYRNALNLPHAHGVWHLFVLGGASCHFFSIQSYLAGA